MRPLSEPKRRLVLGLLVVAVLLLLRVGVQDIGPLQSLENLTLDLRFALRGPEPFGDSVIVVMIDDDSIERLRRWPWSRRYYAELVDLLHAAGAKVIAFDVLFTEAGDPLADAALAAAIERAGNVILPLFVTLEAEQRMRSTPASETAEAAYRVYRDPGGAAPHVPLTGQWQVAPIVPLREAAETLGHVNVVRTPEGRSPFEHVAVAIGDTLYPSLGVAVARELLGLSPQEVRLDLESALVLGSERIPLDQKSRLPVNWRGPAGTVPTVPFVDVLDGRVPEDAFQGRAVLVGSDAIGVGDTFRSPFDPALSGVERHATVVDSLVRGDLITRDGLTGAADVLLILSGGGLGAVVVALTPPLIGALAAAFLAAAVGAAIILAFVEYGLWLDFVLPVAAPVLVFAAVALDTYFRQHREARRIRKAFSRYLHPTLVDRLIKDPTALEPGGERRELTVLFADIRGFSGIAERLSPEQLVGFMTDYLSAMTDLVLEERGLLDKYIGDGILAVYGAPLALPDHAYRACRTGLRMVAAVRASQDRWRAWGVEDLRIGVGINTGEMIVGNIGSTERFEYTVLGDEVNIGARLETLTKAFGADIVVSEATWRLVRGRIACRELGSTPVPGRRQEVRVFAALAEEGTEAPALIPQGRAKRAREPHGQANQPGRA